MSSLPRDFSGITWHCLARPLGGATPVWPGDRPVQIHCTRLMIPGATVQVSEWSASLHAGTHLDAPRHLFPEAGGIEAFPPGLCLSLARVMDVSGKRRIGLADLPAGTGVTTVLFKTGSCLSHTEFNPEYGFVSPDAAAALAAANVRIVGIDTPSVDPFDSVDLPAHRVLLGSGIFLLENLDLEAAPPGDGLLVLAPLPLAGGEASPVCPFLGY